MINIFTPFALNNPSTPTPYLFSSPKKNTLHHARHQHLYLTRDPLVAKTLPRRPALPFFYIPHRASLMGSGDRIMHLLRHLEKNLIDRNSLMTGNPPIQ